MRGLFRGFALFRRLVSPPYLIDIIPGFRKRRIPVIFINRLRSGIIGGQGQGQITYTIKPKAGLPTGTTITNVATIVFDANPSIATDQLNPHDTSAGSDPAKQTLVTIINGPPASHVIALTPKENDSFTVKWSGDDGLGGASLAKFDVFVSQDGGLFTAWQTGLAATSARYTGAVAGHSYAFYVVATDYVGHMESKVALAETQTTISDNLWQNAENRLDVVCGLLGNFSVELQKQVPQPGLPAGGKQIIEHVPGGEPIFLDVLEEEFGRGAACRVMWDDKGVRNRANVHRATTRD